MNFISNCHRCCGCGCGLETTIRAPDWCPEQRSWPSVLPFFLTPGRQLVQRAGRRDGPLLFAHVFWTGAGHCSAPSIPPHHCSLSSPVPRRGARFSGKHNFSQFYFTFATAATNINPETGQKALPERVLLKQRQRPAGNPRL